MKINCAFSITDWVSPVFPDDVYAADETSSESKELVSYEPVEYIEDTSDGYDSASSFTADDAHSE